MNQDPHAITTHWAFLWVYDPRMSSAGQLDRGSILVKIRQRDPGEHPTVIIDDEVLHDSRNVEAIVRRLIRQLENGICSDVLFIRIEELEKDAVKVFEYKCDGIDHLYDGTTLIKLWWDVWSGMGNLSDPDPIPTAPRWNSDPGVKIEG